MINKIRILYIVFVFAIPFAEISAADDDFDQFKQQQAQGVGALQNDFEAYKKQLKEGFEAYKKAYKAALEEDRNAVKSVWGDYRPGNKKNWVQYSGTEKNAKGKVSEGNSSIRKAVNFETGDVELEIIVDEKTSNKQAEEALKQSIPGLLKTTRKQAFNNDNVSKAVEKSLAGKAQVKSAKVSDKPVLSSLIPEKSIKDPKKLAKITQQYQTAAKTDIRSSKKSGKKIVRVKFKIPVNAPEKSKQFIKTAKRIADKEKIPLTLVMAVMETESAFNPMAKSHVPAYGLMQIVPRSAGQDATAYLFGKAKILSPSYLYNSDNNIELGGAYLHILYFRYLKKIEDPVSRLYCAIAAYNTGAGNVAKAFTGKRNINKAAKKINQLSPRQVYQKLRTRLPYKETQHYVKKVATKLEKYKQI